MPAGTLVDSNVLLDIFTEDAAWLDWSTTAVAAAGEAAPLYINPVVCAEVSVTFSRTEDLEDALPPAASARSALPWAAAFLAGKAFVSYRRKRGGAPAPLPDFFIGAHAAVDGLALLRRDTRQHRTYFPTVQLLASEG